jgi:hypothetical protein
VTRIVTDSGVRNVLGSDPKPAARVRASPADWKALRAEKLEGRSCRVCVGMLAFDPHHLVPKGMGGATGDDVADNIVGLCRGCHDLVEARDVRASAVLGERLTDSERAYVIAKKGAWYLESRYGLTEEAA